MGIELYKHNKEAYSKVQKKFEENNRVAIIHATGTGKSFVSLKWLYDNRNKRCLFLAPTYEIIDQLEQHIKSEGLSLSDFPNLKCSIYPNFARLSQQDIENLHFDNIVLDEFHRCGAQEWGRSINTLLNSNPNAQVLGITATPIRYLDDNRNMAEELFGGNIASEISLTDAVSRGILPMPTYISAIYSFKDDIDRIQSKIDRFENPKYKDVFQKRLDEAKRMLENSKGLPEIFERYIPNKAGKYIVFCKDYDHMQRMMAESQTWFSKVNPNVDIYSVFSEQGRDKNKQNKTDFENSQNDHIKLLFSIEMLNEGVHVEDIDGVIMLRPTMSPIIYLQQLGRALSVGHNAHPIVFDIVNNINCHKSIYEVYEEVRKKVLNNKHEGNFGQEQESISLEEFKIIDELKQFSDMLEMIDSSITQETYTTSKCEMIVQQLIKFKNENGRMPSRTGQTEEEKSLYTAFKYYKRHYTDEQIKLLQENGIPVIVKTQEEKNEEIVYGILEWLDSKGKMPSGSSDDLYERSLYTAFTRNKENFDEEQVALLSAKGIKIESRKGMTSDDILQKIVYEVIEFKKQNGRMPSVANGGEEDSLYQKFNRNKSKFSEEQLIQFQKVGIEVKVATKEEIEKRTTRVEDKIIPTIESLIKFKQEYGKIPSDSSEDKDERSLYQLYLRTKELYTPEQIKLLAENGIIVKEKRKGSIEEIVSDSVDALLEFVLINKRMPSGKAEDKSEQSLYNSFRRNKTKFTDLQKQKLIEIGVPINIDETQSHLIIGSLSMEDQIVFYGSQAEHYAQVNNQILQTYYSGKMNVLNQIRSGEGGQLGNIGGNSNGIRRKN